MVTTVRYRRRHQSSNGRTDATQGELPVESDARTVACGVEVEAERLLRPNCAGQRTRVVLTKLPDSAKRAQSLRRSGVGATRQLDEE